MTITQNHRNYYIYSDETLQAYQNDSPSREEEKDLPSSFSPRDDMPVLLIGDKKIADALQRQFDCLDIFIQTRLEDLRWPRDARVCLPNRMHLIPAHIKNRPRDYIQFFYRLLPDAMLHLYWDKLNITGQGITKAFREKAIETATQNAISYKEAKSCIEGGNCYIFKSCDGSPKAIIGQASLILSFISLYNQEYFCKPKYQSRFALPIPPEAQSEDLVRIAKNLYFFVMSKKVPLPNYELGDFVDKKDVEAWTPLARLTYHMFELTKEKMSRELQIPLDRIAFVLQETFHIDMELFPIPNRQTGEDLVFLHDEQQMFEIQEKIDCQKMPFIEKTLKYSKDRLGPSQFLLEENTKALEKIGCRAVPVPGVLTALYHEGEDYSSSYVSSHWTSKFYNTEAEARSFDSEILEGVTLPCMLNFMNGIFLETQTPRFITTGVRQTPMTSLFKQAFCQKMAEAYPQLTILFLEEERLSKLLTERGGGVRCVISDL